MTEKNCESCDNCMSCKKEIAPQLPKKGHPMVREEVSKLKLKQAIKALNRKTKRKTSRFIPLKALVGDSTMEEFKEEMEQKFEEGMTWMNFGEWVFDVSIEETPLGNRKPKRLGINNKFCYSNINPIWVKDLNRE